MNIMVKFNKEMFKNISKRFSDFWEEDNFNLITLSKNSTTIEELTADNIDSKNVWIEFIDYKENRYRESTFLIHIENNIFTTEEMSLFENDRFIDGISIFKFWSYLYEEVYNYIYENIPMEC